MASLFPKRSLGCPSDTYISSNGLYFNTYCGQDLVAAEIGYSTEPSMTDCMDRCSTYRPICYGITYFSQNGTCSFKVQDITTADLTASDSNNNVDSAIANATQLNPLNTICPYQNNSIINTSDGLPIQILCNLDMLGYGDYCPEGRSCPIHTNTMMECMEICSQAHPLCLGVSWNPDMVAGFGNCYPKNTQNGNNVPDIGFTCHSGLVRLPFVGACLPSIQTQLSSYGKTFNVTCSEGRTGSSNITSYHTTNITKCIDQCAIYTGRDTCLGVFFDNSMQDGSENCYLLNATGSAYFGLNATYAEVISGSGSASSSSPPTTATPPSSSSTPIGTIIGGAIGGLAIVVLAVIGLLYIRKQLKVIRHGLAQSSSTIHNQNEPWSMGVIKPELPADGVVVNREDPYKKQQMLRTTRAEIRHSELP